MTTTKTTPLPLDDSLALLKRAIGAAAEASASIRGEVAASVEAAAARIDEFKRAIEGTRTALAGGKHRSKSELTRQAQALDVSALDNVEDDLTGLAERVSVAIESLVVVRAEVERVRSGGIRSWRT
jgi:hypothetical protein